MIGRPEWFERRKYGGWGISPKTWQGWVYIFVMLLPIVVVKYLGFDRQTIFIYFGFWLLVFFLDVLDIMARLKKDERETHIEAIAERNSSWAMVAVLTIGIGYQVAAGAVSGEMIVDPFLLAALLAGAIAKSVTNYRLERRM
jgi:cobalamin synthase